MRFPRDYLWDLYSLLLVRISRDLKLIVETGGNVAPGAGGQGTPAVGGNGVKETATATGGEKVTATAVAQGIQRAGPTDSLTDKLPHTGDTNMALPTLGVIGTGAAAGTFSGNGVGVMTVIPGPLTTEVYTTVVPGSGTDPAYTSVITKTTRGPSMTVPASLQTTEPGDHSVPVGVI